MPETVRWFVYVTGTILMASVGLTGYLGFCTRRIRGKDDEKENLPWLIPSNAPRLHEIFAKMVIPFWTLLLVAIVEISLITRYGLHARPRPLFFGPHTACWIGFILFYAAALRWNGIDVENKRTHHYIGYLCVAAAAGMYLLGMMIAYQLP